MDAARTIKNNLEYYTVIELCDLLDAINEELKAREVEYESEELSGKPEDIENLWDEYQNFWEDDDA